MILKMQLKSRYSYTFLIGICLILSGCGKSPQLPVIVNTNAHTNPDAHGASKPVVLTLYQLTQPQPFKSLNYDKLRHPTQQLGSTIIDYKTIELPPNQKKDLKIPLYTKTKVIGMVAGFHHIKTSHWKSTVTLPNKTHGIKLKVNLNINRIDWTLSKGLF